MDRARVGRRSRQTPSPYYIFKLELGEIHILDPMLHLRNWIFLPQENLRDNLDAVADHPALLPNFFFFAPIATKLLQRACSGKKPRQPKFGPISPKNQTLRKM